MSGQREIIRQSLALRGVEDREPFSRSEPNLEIIVVDHDVIWGIGRLLVRPKDLVRRRLSLKCCDQVGKRHAAPMRMPFFTQPGAQNCVLDYYRNLFGITTQPFPDPGSAATASTGIYINDGELVYMPAITQYDPQPGFFGGLGMSEQEAWDFYVIGALDGGWGAFYDISCLYPIRTLLFGFSTNHQLIQGTFDASGSFAPDPEQGKEVADSLGHPLSDVFRVPFLSAGRKLVC
jgi:hypothetical protein